MPGGPWIYVFWPGGDSDCHGVLRAFALSRHSASSISSRIVANKPNAVQSVRPSARPQTNPSPSARRQRESRRALAGTAAAANAARAHDPSAESSVVACAAVVVFSGLVTETTRRTSTGYAPILVPACSRLSLFFLTRLADPTFDRSTPFVARQYRLIERCASRLIHALPAANTNTHLRPAAAPCSALALGAAAAAAYDDRLWLPPCVHRIKACCWWWWCGLVAVAVAAVLCPTNDDGNQVSHPDSKSRS